MAYDFSLLCKLLYHATNFPVYLYQKKNLSLSFPEKALDYPPASEYLNTIRLWKKQMVCYQSDLTSYYGYFLLPDDTEILIGPVSNVPYSLEMLSSIRRKLGIPKTEESSFTSFMSDIPIINTSVFVHFLTYSYYLLTGECITIDDLIGAGEDFSPLYQKVHNRYLEDIYEPQNTNDSDSEKIYWQEKRLMDIVEHGNTDTLSAFSDFQMPHYFWDLPTDNLEYLKYTSITVLTLASRAAIRGGLSCDYSFHIEESYIRKIVSLKTAESVGLLLAQALSDFTSHVAALKLTQRSDNMLMDAIRYIQENCTQAITVCDVASHVGYSRTYLSKKFKEELHFSVSSFIMRCRLEHAKELLRYTNKSLSEISSCLNFSSQSHFQKAFKEAFHITPLVYRRTEEKQ